MSSSNDMCSSRFNVGTTLISRTSKSRRPPLSLRGGVAALGRESCQSSDILDSNEANGDGGMFGLKESAFQNTLHA